jgi:hypothetical protein
MPKWPAGLSHFYCSQRIFVHPLPADLRHHRIVGNPSPLHAWHNNLEKSNFMSLLITICAQLYLNHFMDIAFGYLVNS